MNLRIPEGGLVVVADGGSARVFTNIGSQAQPLLKQHGALLQQDVQAQGPAGAMPSDTPLAQLDEATFAKQLAAELNDGALKNQYQHLVLVADPQTLGRVRPLLHKQAQQRLLADVAKDLTNARLEDIQRALC